MAGSRPYERFLKEELILRDELAIDRTLLANERTLMAYVRLAITLVIAGISIIHFAMENWFETIGFLCVPVGIAAGLFGWSRYQKMDRQIREIQNLPRGKKSKSA
jgi:putative membrane protein